MRFDIPHFLAIIKQSLGSVGSGARAVRGRKAENRFFGRNRDRIDLSSTDLGGSYTLVRRE